MSRHHTTRSTWRTHAFSLCLHVACPTARLDTLHTSNVSCRIETWRAKWNLGLSKWCYVRMHTRVSKVNANHQCVKDKTHRKLWIPLHISTLFSFVLSLLSVIYLLFCEPEIMTFDHSMVWHKYVRSTLFELDGTSCTLSPPLLLMVLSDVQIKLFFAHP